jgi:hypothetical protein
MGNVSKGLCHVSSIWKENIPYKHVYSIWNIIRFYWFFFDVESGKCRFVKPQVLAGAVIGEIQLDRTMKQLVKIVKEHYSEPIEGRLHLQFASN